MISKYRLFIVYGLLIAAAIFVHTHGDVYVPSSKPLEEIPRHENGWRMAEETRFDERVLEVLKPTDYISRMYQDGEGKRVSIYLGYHGGGPESGPIHSPKHCLPGSGWHEMSSVSGEMNLGGERINLVRSTYQNGYAKELFLYWYQVKGRTLNDEYALKFAEVKNSILHNRRDSAFVRVSVPFEEDVEQAVAVGERFIRDFYPHIQRVLPN
ncbi:EpsI family protein [Desulfuromonas versatilis]|uniref:EpsI family protein n=1 Tax=Desulfuromonas versatilis TaxID=2802975 RepID=A0ABN6DZ75_9BACT|nr:exosortase C-terminal domain/associated protein EpsI [Desulfuromonas versatilis]BCR05271.1 EpsI family protein [Desulfuromonas versatilis]